MHPIRRLYGEDNASVRRELSKIETESTDYWRTGIKGDQVKWVMKPGKTTHGHTLVTFLRGLHYQQILN